MSLNQTIQRLFSSSLTRSVRRRTMVETSVSPSLSESRRLMGTVSPSVMESRTSLSQLSSFSPGLVIFDKDGTLVCFHTMWNSWCEQLASRMKEETETEVSRELYSMLGYDIHSKRVRMGMLAEKTHPYIKEKVEEMLITEHKFSQWEARNVMDKTWKDTPENMQIKMTGNIGVIFQQLKDQGVKIAICTSDSREGTEEFLYRLSLSSFVDLVLCGDDKDSISKPSPHNALFICDQLGVDPTKAIMVGDTPADTIMGQTAQLGLTIGVLTGVGDHEDLADADIIMNDVGGVVDLLCPDVTKEGTNSPVYITNRGLAKIVGKQTEQ